MQKFQFCITPPPPPVPFCRDLLAQLQRVMAELQRVMALAQRKLRGEGAALAWEEFH